jgi:DNA-binding CsgD family transcriptional regulator
LERAVELGELAEELDRIAISQTGRLCLIGGEAGVGKTALVRRFSDHRPAARWFWGACDPLFTARPLGPFTDIAESAGGELDRLVHGQARPYEVASALLHLLQERSPAIAVLEDLHWADEATLDVIRLLGRRVESAPGLLIATYRDDELGRDHPLRVVLGEMPRHESIVRMKVMPLSPAAVATLAGASRVDADELYRKTAGNPFFVTEVLASTEHLIPSTVRDAVLARASRLSPNARTLLDAVAVSPHEAEIWLLERVSPTSFGALGECLDAGMLTRQNGAVAFRHELARLAIDDSIPPDRAIQLHRLTLHALSDSPRGDIHPARLAHHAEHANEPESLLRFSRASGRRASGLGAHREAAAQFARAVTAAEALEPVDRGELLQEFADESLHVAQVDRSIEAQEKAVQLFRKAGDTVREAGALRRLSRFYSCGVLGHKAHGPLERAVTLLEVLPPSKDLAIVSAMTASLDLDRGAAESALAHARHAVEIAELAGDDEALLYTLNSLGTIEIWLGNHGGREKLLRSMAMADELGMDEHAGRGFLNLAEAEVNTRSYDGLLELIARGTEYCSQHGLELWRLWLMTSEARAHLDRGDLSRAADAAEMVLHGERGQLPRISALPVLGLVRARRGDPLVWPLLDEAKTMAERDGQLQYAVQIAVARAEAAWLEGRPDAVRNETEAAYAKAVSLGTWWYLGEMACWRRRAGIQDDDVRPEVSRRYAAELHGEFDEAARLWTALGCDYDAAMALASSDDDDLLRRSLVKLQRLGARAAAAVVARKLRAHGATGISRGPRATTQRNPASLTDRELEVLELIQAGMRNAQIAKRLFLATKTVDHHVSAILRKLSVDTRAQAAREASRLGLFT